MNQIAKVIGRIIAILVDRGVIERKDAVWILEPLKESEQKPKIGQWVLTDVEGSRVWHCNCSECGKDPQNYVGGSGNWWLIKNNLPKFCPSCGAKMTAESEETE